MERAKVGIIGCGDISGIYCRNGTKFDDLEIVACASRNFARAQATAAEHGIPKALTLDEIFAEPEVQAIVNLTVPGVHAAINRRALEAGKHVYSEKPLAISRADGAALVALAQRRGLRLGCAPDTFLGAGLQTCRKLIDEGMIGEPLGAAGWMMSRGPENWHPNPEFFYAPGAGPLFDIGPYYLTAMVSLLGPIRRLTGSARASFPERLVTGGAHKGRKIPVRTPTHLSGVFDFASGAIGTLSTSFDVHATTLPPMEIYGSEGTLLVPDPNTFGGSVKVRLAGEAAFLEIPLAFSYAENCRGIGVADMAAAIRTRRPHRASAEMAFHVLDVMTAFEEASTEGRHIAITSTMTRPAPLPTSLSAGRIDQVN